MVPAAKRTQASETAQKGPGRNRRAVNATVKALRAAGRVEASDAATVAAAESLADAVDENPFRATLWKEYQFAIAQLGLVGKGSAPDGLDELLAEIARAPVGDSTEP